MNSKIYQNLTQRINQILDGKSFVSKKTLREELSLGKYSKWAVSIKAEQLVPILCAINELSKYSPDIKHIPINKQVRENLYKIYIKKVKYSKFFNKHQIIALSFLRDIAGFAGEITIENSYFSWKNYDFENNLHWIDSLRTPSDFFGIIWHTRGLALRYDLRESNVKIISGRSGGYFLEALDCLTRIGQGKQTYYRCGLIENGGIALLPESMKETVY